MSDFSVLALLACALGLIAIGIGGLVLSRNLFRIVLALSLAEAGANLLLVLVGFRHDAIAPIIEPGRALTTMVDPIPQAMVLTSIVIGVGVQALALALAIRARASYGTLDMAAMRQHMESDINRAAGSPPDSSQHAPASGPALPLPGATPERLACKAPQA